MDLLGVFWNPGGHSRHSSLLRDAFIPWRELVFPQRPSPCQGPFKPGQSWVVLVSRAVRDFRRIEGLLAEMCVNLSPPPPP